MDNNFNEPNNSNNSFEQDDSASNVSSAFSDDSSRRLMNSDGQQIPQPYQNQPVPPQYQQMQGQPMPPQYQPMQGQPMPPQYQPMQGQPMPPQYQPMQGQPMPPQYQSMQGQPMPPQYQPMQGQPVLPQYQPMQGQPMPPQYQPMQGQPMPPQYQQMNYYQPAVYYSQQPNGYYMSYPPVVQVKQYSPTRLFRKHCSRVGLTAMADVGLMVAVQLIVLIGGVIIYSILQEAGIINIDYVSANANIVMFAMGLSAIVGNMVPSISHGHKWRIKFTDPFKGDKLNAGFVITAAITAIGLNFIWGIIYNILESILSGGIVSSASEGYTMYNTPPVALWLMVIWSCVIAPVTEEYIFRGIIMRTLAKHGGMFALIASSLMFGLMHGNLSQTPMAFLVGLVMGYVAMKSGNIRQSIAIHMANNTLVTIPQVVLYYLPEAEDMLNWIYLIVEFGAMIFAVVTLIYFAVVHVTGKRARAQRIQSGSEIISAAENRLIKIEIPECRLKPEFVLVKHKFLHFISSGGMIFFILFTLFEIWLNTFFEF